MQRPLKHLQHAPVSEALSKDLPKFCFPFVSERYGDPPVVVDDRDTYSFVLTEDTGVQQFGYCRLIKVCKNPRLMSLTATNAGLLYCMLMDGFCSPFQESGGSVTLICLCILSYLPQVEFFDQILDVLIDFWEHSLDKVKLLLDGLYALPLPHGGETVTLKPKV